MLKNFKNWLLENKYSELTSADYRDALKDFAVKKVNLKITSRLFRKEVVCNKDLLYTFLI